MAGRKTSARSSGLRAGMVFRAAVHPTDATGVSHLVEVERFNPQPPRALPTDEHVTLALKTVLELRYGHAIAGSRKH